MTSQINVTQKEHVRTFLKFGPEPQLSSSSILRESIGNDKAYIKLSSAGDSCTFCGNFDKKPGSGQKLRRGDREAKIIQKDAQDFLFEKIYGPSSTSADCFEGIGIPAVERAVAGKNSTIIVSSGIYSEKSSIIYGSAMNAPGAPKLGLVQSCCIHAVDLVEGIPNARLFFKFIEVDANEDINDLIDPQRKCLGTKENNGRVEVEGVYLAEFKNVEEAQYFIGLGIHNGSSVRSHRILTIEVVLEKERNLQRGIIRFVDIAAIGEAPRRNVSVATSPNTPREAGGINKAVLAIRLCIDSLILARPYVPWRDSKFAFLLKDDFRADFAVSFLIIVSSDSRYLSESLELMAFGASARKIEIANQILAEKPDQKAAIASYKREVSTLQGQIKSLQSMQLASSDSSQVQKFKERVELLTKIIFFLMDPKKAQEIQDMDAPSISVDELHRVFQFQVKRIFCDVQNSRDHNDFTGLQRMIAIGQSMAISSQVKHFVAPAHWSLLSCKQLQQTKTESMFDIAEWETNFQEAYRKVNVAIKAYSVYSTQSTLPNDANLVQFLKYIVNFMFGRLVDKKSGSLVCLITKPATRQKILKMSENVIAVERSLEFQKHVLADNIDAVAVMGVISDWISQFYFRLLDLVRILKTFVSSEGQLLPDQAKFNANWMFSCVSAPLVWQQCSTLSDLCFEKVHCAHPSALNSNLSSSKEDNAPFFREAGIKLHRCIQNSCSSIVDMLNPPGRKFLTNCCLENKLLPVEDHVIDCDLCKISYPEILEFSPLMQLGPMLIIFCSQKHVELSLLTIINTHRIQKMRCYSELVRETREMDHVLEILSLNETGQPSMICLNFQSIFRRSCWVANLQRFCEIEENLGEEMETVTSSLIESKMSQAVERYTTQPGQSEVKWGVFAQMMEDLETQLLTQESRKAETELVNIISQPALKPGDVRAITSAGTEIFDGANEAWRLGQSADTSAKISASKNSSPKKEVVASTPIQSAPFTASFNQPNVGMKIPTAGDLIFARDAVKKTAIQKAIETGASAIPSLRQGEILIKFNKASSKNTERYVMLLDKTNMLVWGSIEKFTSNLNLREVLGISLGMGSSTLRKAYCAEDHGTLPKLTNGNCEILLFGAVSIPINFEQVETLLR
jgi:hypothetical protein